MNSNIGMQVPKAIKSLACVVSLIESNDVWWAEERERQYPNNTGLDELNQWLRRAQDVVNGLVSDLSVLKAENELRLFVALVDVKAIDWSDPDITWSETLRGARAIVNGGRLPDITRADVVRAKAFGFAVKRGGADCLKEALRGRWWWTLTQPGSSGAEASEGGFSTERKAWADAVRTLREDPSLKPVPHSNAGHPPKPRVDQLGLITRLVEWSENTGGWDAPVWQEAAALVGAGQVAPDGRSLALKDEAQRIARLVLDGDDETVLDSVVHDAFSALATEINNDGPEAQVKYLLSNGWTEADILKDAGVYQAPSVPSPNA